jgi:hypothetical protein
LGVPALAGTDAAASPTDAIAQRKTALVLI